jgi:hypothetical protein
MDMRTYKKLPDTLPEQISAVVIQYYSVKRQYISYYINIIPVAGKMSTYQMVVNCSSNHVSRDKSTAISSVVLALNCTIVFANIYTVLFVRYLVIGLRVYQAD